MNRTLTISLTTLAVAGLALIAAAEGSDSIVQGIRARAAGLAHEARAEERLSVSLRRVNDEASKPRARVGDYLATEFRIDADQLRAERRALDVSWGDLMLARTLLANTALPLEPRDLIGLRHEGLGWAAIAGGLELDPDSTVAAAHEESRVASGMIKADGRVAPIAARTRRAGS